MFKLVFEAIQRYFKTLSNLGYKKQKDVDKLLVFIFIQELLDNDFYGYVTKEDYDIIDKALYCLFGHTCLIPYPDYYNPKNKRIMYLGSLSELVHRQEQLENTVNNLEFSGDGSGINQNMVNSISYLENAVSSIRNTQGTLSTQQSVNTATLETLKKKVVIVPDSEEVVIDDIDISDLNN